jgi:hypothetical protein
MKRILVAVAVVAFFGVVAQAASQPNAARYAGAFTHPVAKESVPAFAIEEPELGDAGQASSGTHSVMLTWNASPDAPANPTLTYNAYRLTGACSSTATFTKINTAPITALTFTDASVAPGAYCYYVTAALNGIESVPSNQAAAAILVLPPGSVVLSAK